MNLTYARIMTAWKWIGPIGGIIVVGLAPWQTADEPQSTYEISQSVREQLE